MVCIIFRMVFGKRRPLPSQGFVEKIHLFPIMMKLTRLYFLFGILTLLAIVTSYPVSQYGVHYAHLVSRANGYNPYPQQMILSPQHCNSARMSFADSSDSSSGYRTRQCMFQILPAHALNTMPKIPRRQTDNMLPMKAPSVPVPSTMKPAARIELVGATPPLTFLKISSPRYWPSGTPATFTHFFGPDLHHSRDVYSTITTREPPQDPTTTAHATFHTTKEPRGDA